MQSFDVERLKISSGRDATTDDLLALDQLLQRRQQIHGRGVRSSSYPWGTSTSFNGQASAFAAPFFQPTVNRSGKNFIVSWQKGEIAGIEPVIPGQGQKGTPISGDPNTKVVPTFTITPDLFSAAGESFVYFELQFDTNWIVQQIVPVAAAAYVVDGPWTAHKLALVVYNDGRSPWRALYRNIGWLAANRRQAAGKALHFFWAVES